LDDSIAEIKSKIIEVKEKLANDKLNENIDVEEKSVLITEENKVETDN